MSSLLSWLTSWCAYEPEPLVIIGGRQTYDWILDTCDRKGIPVLGVLDKFYAGRVDFIGGLPCLGSELDLIDNPRQFGDAKFFVGSFWDGDSTETNGMSGYELRLERIRLVEQLGLELYTLVDPRAMLSKDVQIGAGSYVSRGVSIRGGTKIGRHCTLLDGSGIANDVVLGDNCILSAAAGIMSNVTLGKNVYVGTRATVLNGHSTKQDRVAIGDNCKIHAHALVTGDMEPNTTAMFTGRTSKRKDLEV